MMNFESLANELILDLFEYFDGLDVLRMFFGLNERFNQLLSHQFQAYTFNFRSISRLNFDRICRDYLPLITNQVISFHLSDNDETPNLSEDFLALGFHFDRFISLKSLALDSIHSPELLNQIIVQCHSLRYLRRLKITNCNINLQENDGLMNHIWSLPVTHCFFESFFSKGQCFSNIQMVCKSMKYLVIDSFYEDLNSLYHLLDCTPNLRHLSISLNGYTTTDDDDEMINPRRSTLNSLKLVYRSSIKSLTNFLQYLPNLTSLIITMPDVYLNGNEWERILRDYLPNVRKLCFRMNVPLSDNDEKEQQIDDLLKTFRTNFWLKEHQWFVQCDWSAFGWSELVLVYTLPYDFNDFSYYDTIQSRSTHCNPMEYPVYDRVHTLRHSFSDTLPMNEIVQLNPRFSSIIDLQLYLPLTDHFSSCLASLEHLKYLHVTIIENSFDQQLQFLLDRATNLYSLTLRSRIYFQIDFMQITSASLRRLDLQSKSFFRLDYFDDDDCRSLTQSSIGKQCEVLLISVKTRSTIRDLIDQMFNLRSLTIQCKEDKYSIHENDGFIQWLSEHVPDNCSIVRDEQQRSKIHLWIK